MALVKVIDSCMVVPEVETPKHRLWLSNIDLQGLQYAANFSVYKFNGESDSFYCREKLKASLSKALVPFYPLAGRLVRGNDGRVEVNCNAEGVLFLVAETDSTVDEFGDFTPSTDIWKVLVPAVPSPEPPCIVLLLQVTYFRCGGVTLGVTVHHTTVDGLSSLHFINTWAGINRGADDLLPPFLDRRLLRARSPPKVLIEHPFYRLPKKTQEPPATDAKPFSTATFHLSVDQVAALKSTSGHTHLGTFKAVVAYVWRCFCMARGLADDEETSLSLVVDARNRLYPPLPKCFFGNSTFMIEVVAKAGAIVSESLECSANRIHEVTSRLGDEHVRSLVDLLELRRREVDVTDLKSLWLRQPVTSLHAVSWLGLPIYETDFGWGKPILVQRVSLESGRMVFILHNPRSKGGVSLIMTLETECMPAFEEAFYHGLSSGVVVGQ